MDVLSDVLATLRDGPTLCARTRAYAPWGLRFGGRQGFGFHVVLDGICWLAVDGMPPRELRPGDVVLLAAGAEHTLADDPATSAVTFRLDDDRPPAGGGPADDRPLAGDPAGGDPAGGDPAGGDPPGRRIGHRHVTGAPGGAETVLLSGAYRLEPRRPHPVLATLPDLVHLPHRRRRGRHGLYAAVELLGAEVEEQDPGAEAIVSALVDALLVYILRAWQEEHPTGWSRALADRSVAASLHRIHQDPARPWTVAQLADTAGLPRATFTRRFGALVGEPPLTYLTRWRLVLAARVLREQDVPLSVVGRRVGYTSEFAFAKAFKREYGVAPGAYRRAGRPADALRTGRTPIP